MASLDARIAVLIEQRANRGKTWQQVADCVDVGLAQELAEGAGCGANRFALEGAAGVGEENILGPGVGSVRPDLDEAMAFEDLERMAHGRLGHLHGAGECARRLAVAGTREMDHDGEVRRVDAVGQHLSEQRCPQLVDYGDFIEEREDLACFVPRIHSVQSSLYNSRQPGNTERVAKTRCGLPEINHLPTQIPKDLSTEHSLCGKALSYNQIIQSDCCDHRAFCVTARVVDAPF
ncbi:hypothetical protein HOE425_333219 [Hoeflea sp. EC-HK425]|nr:hypothetical protein HOE425_333219 [Hoeflea sp. EC-HK425]